MDLAQKKSLTQIQWVGDFCQAIGIAQVPAISGGFANAPLQASGVAPQSVRTRIAHRPKLVCPSGDVDKQLLNQVSGWTRGLHPVADHVPIVALPLEEAIRQRE